MADNSALHAQLEALDHELEEGDITRKGYEKRRTMILSQYLGPQEVERLNTGLRVHSADDSSHPGSEIANNAAAAAAVLGESAGTGAGGGGYVAYPQDLDGDAASLASYGDISRGPYGNGGGDGYGQAITPGYDAGRPSQVQRFQAQQLGMRPPTQRQSSYGTPGTGERPGSPGSYYGSTENTMIGSDYAFNPDGKAPPAHAGSEARGPLKDCG